MSGYVVTGPLAVVHDSAGKIHYLYEGAQLPDDVSADEVERLTHRGLVGKPAGEQTKAGAAKKSAG